MSGFEGLLWIEFGLVVMFCLGLCVYVWLHPGRGVLR